MTGPSRFLQDVLNEPKELRAILGRLLGPQRQDLQEAARALAAAPVAWIAGMGSSWHGGFAVQAIFDAAGKPARNADAGELLHFSRLPERSTLLVLSRSGRSVEVVELAKKARSEGATLVGVTNDPESPLAKLCRPALLLGAPYDFNVSVTMYSGVALAGALAAAMAVGIWQEGLGAQLDAVLVEAAARMSGWRDEVAASDWVAPESVTVLLARGAGLAAALEARQLYEEAAKHPATALSTGAFRHGPNEVVRPGCRVVLWLPADQRLRKLDLALAADLRRAGAKVALVGAELPRDTRSEADLRLELPTPAFAPVPAARDGSFQFLTELMPVRLLVEGVARARGVDSDRFQFCPFVVESEEGLGEGHAKP